MHGADAYILLVASLPRSERLFLAKQPPLSRERLARRLTLLSEADAASLKLIDRILSWPSYRMDETDPEVVRAAGDMLARIPQPALRKIVTLQLEMRTILAALRRRRDGKPVPTEPWGFGPCVQRIEDNWSEPTFRLEARHPWIGEAAALIERADPVALERHLLETAFAQMQRLGAYHLFDFEAVAIYVMKWTVFDSWAHGNGVGAKRRFQDLTDAAFDAVKFPHLVEATP